MIQQVAGVEANSDIFVLEISYFDTDPVRFFTALSRLIESLQALDRTLAKSIDSRLETAVLLESVQEGSILLAIRNIIESIDDDAIKDLSIKKVIGAFLVRGKYRLLNFLGGMDKFRNVDEIMQIQAQLEEEAKDIENNELIPYRRVNSRDLLYNIAEIQVSLEEFDSRDEIEYKVPSLPESKAVPFNRNFFVDPAEIDDFVTRDILSSTLEMILKIKKADFLGKSRWEFRHGKDKIEAKIMDEEWLKGFQKGDFTLRAGNALRAAVTIETKYDFNGEVVSETYTIQKVDGIISGKPPSQIELSLELDTGLETED